MRSIGILNLQQVDNFGCVLGAYAIQRVAQDISGDHVELIDYRHIKGKHSFLAKAMRALRSSAVYGVVGTVKKHKRALEIDRLIHRDAREDRMSNPERQRKFEAFRNAYFQRSKPYPVIDNKHIPEYDTYLVGSDVVWLLDDLWMEHSPALLDFTRGMNCRRVSYAASLGDFSAQIGKRAIVKRLYRRGLRRFDAVSVREETSAAYLAPLYSGEIHCCMDPTLLLSAEDYDQVMPSVSEQINRGYIYVYMLDDTGDFYKTVNEISKQVNLPIVRCCDQTNGYESIAAEAEEDGPLEFLKRIKDAELVITNSFHAVCFSLIYHKNFFAVRRSTQAYKTEELLKRLGLMDRYLDASECSRILEQSIDFKALDQKLKLWRDESMKYLTEALEVGGKRIRRRSV